MLPWLCCRCWSCPQFWDGTAPVPPSNLDGVALHLVIKGRALNAEQLGGFLLVAMRLGKRLEDRLSLDVIEACYAAAARGSGSGLQRRRQLNLRRQFFDPDYVIPCQDDGVLNGVLQFPHISRP